MSDVETVIMNYANDPVYSIPDIVIKKAISLYREAKDIGFTDNNIETSINEDGIQLTFQKGDEFLDINVSSEFPIYTLNVEKGIGSEYEEEFIDSTDAFDLTIGLLVAFYNRDDFFETIRIRNRGW